MRYSRSAATAARVLRMMRDHVVTTTAGRDIPVKAATVCVHSDTPSAVAIPFNQVKIFQATVGLFIISLVYFGSFLRFDHIQ